MCHVAVISYYNYIIVTVKTKVSEKAPGQYVTIHIPRHIFE